MCSSAPSAQSRTMPDARRVPAPSSAQAHIGMRWRVMVLRDLCRRPDACVRNSIPGPLRGGGLPRWTRAHHMRFVQRRVTKPMVVGADEGTHEPVRTLAPQASHEISLCEIQGKAKIDSASGGKSRSGAHVPQPSVDRVSLLSGQVRYIRQSVVQYRIVEPVNLYLPWNLELIPSTMRRHAKHHAVVEVGSPRRAGFFPDSTCRIGCSSDIDSSCGTFAWKRHHGAGDDDLLTIGLGEQRPRLVEA